MVHSTSNSTDYTYMQGMKLSSSNLAQRKGVRKEWRVQRQGLVLPWLGHLVRREKRGERDIHFQVWRQLHKQIYTEKLAAAMEDNNK